MESLREKKIDNVMTEKKIGIWNGYGLSKKKKILNFKIEVKNGCNNIIVYLKIFNALND